METKLELLNRATKAYDEGHPFMSDQEWDDLYFELKKENPSAVDTITYDVVNELKKVTHNHPMLSLDKTKDIKELEKFAAGKKVCVMPKYDGLSCSLTYEKGKLVRAETRGNGIEGEDITHNAMVIPSIPKNLPLLIDIIIDGEILCKEDVFENLFSKQYSNARNFAAGSIRLLDSKECEKRKLSFQAWDLIEIKDYSLSENSLSGKLDFLVKLKFNTSYVIVDNLEDLKGAIDFLKKQSRDSFIPIDGVVVKVDNCKEYAEMGMTAHHPRGALAYKFYDETYPTRLFNIEWTMGRLGTLTPVATFEPIKIEGAIVSRANLHNISIMKELLGEHPYQGQKLEIYRSNMIIPQVYSSDKSKPEYLVEYFDIPKVCPYCGKELIIKNNNGSEVLYCENPECESNLIVRLDHFAGKKGLDIKGLSRATLKKLINEGWINSAIDIFYLNHHRDEWIKKSGFGVKSVDKILNAIEESKNCTFEAFISAIGIPLIGNNNAKELTKHFNSYKEFRDAVDNDYSFFNIPNFGFEMSESILSFDYQEADKITEILSFKEKDNDNLQEKTDKLQGLIFVITGTLKFYPNRNSLTELIEKNGGKVTNKISSKVNYLINNDINSKSAKNKAAKESNIPIISEEEFKKKFAL